MYKKAPSAIPKNMKNLISPLLKIKIEYKTIIPVIIQNIISSIYVTKSLVLKLSLKILKKSNIKPIYNPFITNIKNKYA